MPGLFPGPMRTSPVPPPLAVPDVEEEKLKKFQKRRKGRAETFLTGELVPEPIGKEVLG